jgi:hypothetical protein
VSLAARHNGDRRLKDDDINRIFPPSTWRICTGPAGTMIVADTLGFHRGGKPTAGTRLLVTFTYTSGTPLVGRAVRLKGKPVWISSAIQRYALKQMDIAPARDGNKKKQPAM